MNIVEPYAKIASFDHHGRDNTFTKEEGIGLLRKIEWCGRISHRSEDAQTEGSWDRFIRAVVLQHGDWSITEHASLTVDMLVDRGITHEIVRHRLFAFTQECVSGDTRLSPSLTIREAHERNYVGRKIKSSDGSIIVKNRIAHIFSKGTAQVFSVVTKSGYRIKTTLAHEFQIPSKEFLRLEYLTVGDAVMVNGRPCLMKIDDVKLKQAFFHDGLSPVEIADRELVPYSTVTRRLRQLGVFRDYRNDKNPEKYNHCHTSDSHNKMRHSVIEGYRNGRKPWNKGITESTSTSVARQANSLRVSHHNNGEKELNSNWKGGVAKTAREESRRKKARIVTCEVCTGTRTLQVHHIDENPRNNADDNLIKLCYECHRKVHGAFRVGVQPVADEITSIVFAGWEEVFDLEMQTHHNYVANGFVVHNSTRFVNYEKKMPPSFIRPDGLNDDAFAGWVLGIQAAEGAYKRMIASGCAPQIARSVFPNALASRILITGNLRNWRHFMLMRSTKEAHPQMRQVTIPLLAELQEKVPIIFDDIIPLSRQVDNIAKGR